MADTVNLKVGDIAPAFKLAAHPAGEIALSQFTGKQNVVLYFYPRDDTPGCTTEACDFRDNLARIQQADTAVLGISADDVASHEKFATKFSLSFPLLADVDHAVCDQYGVWGEKTNFGKTYMGINRTTFLIDKQGKIAAIWPSVKVPGHVDAVQEAITKLKT